MIGSDTNSENQWDNYWNNDGAEGEVFVSASGAAHPELADWWRQQFAPLSTGDMVDLACGAGSVFAHLPDHHDHRLFGADISSEALNLMRKRIPGVTTTVCSAHDLPYEDQQFDVVCSQFGIEYAGALAFEEAARVVKPGGRLMVIAHYAHGQIDARNREHREHAHTIVSSNFIDKAIKLTAASYAQHEQRFRQATEEFVPAERQLAAACEALPEGIHFHLYGGFRQLFEQRRQYDADDIITWLQQMRDDVAENLQRLEHMCRAASDQDEMSAIINELEKRNCREINCEALTLEQHKLPLAWALTARR
ncbi:MAG: class I SAM-dependent methyltransferase [Pseudomonadota bacterium]